MKRRFSVFALTLVTLSSALTGCDLWVPQSTLTNGETSDGVSGQVGQIYVANAVLIASEGKANLVVSLVNEGTRDIDLLVADGTPQRDQKVVAKAAKITQVGTDGNQIVVLTNFDGKPGALYPLYFQYGEETGLKLGVPVLTNQQPQYKDLGPESVR